MRYCRQHFRKPRDASAPFRAAVSVMDAKTGELLALASYPVAEDLETFGGSTNARNRLLRNHNFTRLPIGSVAKVPLAAAILDHAPFLADLRIPGYSATQHERLLGITLAKPLEDHPVPLAEIDLERFLEHSSNRYAAVLLTLALGVDEAGHSLREPDPASPVPDRLQREDGFAISGRPFERRPRLDLNLRADPDDRSHVVAERMATDTLEHVKHAERLALLFDLWTSRKTDEGATATLAPRSAPGRGNDHIDTSIWLPLLNYLYPKGIPTSTSTGWAGYEPFVGVSPERENLAYNLISDYRAQYLSVILGGASSTFTTPKLCEMFSRLVTGKRIATTLTRRIQSGQVPIAGANRGVDIDALPMNPAVRQRLATALTLVAGGTGGTAKSLAPLLASYEKALAARGKTLGFFSKTGSPRNEMPVPSRFTRAVDALIRAGALHLDTNGRIHYRESGPVDMDGRRPSAALEALRANGDDLAILRRHRVSERAVLNVCDTYNDTDRRDRTQFQVDTRTGRLVRMATLPRIEATGGTYVFVMGTYDQKARLANHERGSSLPAVDVVANLPERALAVAINVEGQGKGPAVAVPLAGELLKEVLWKALETGW